MKHAFALGCGALMLNLSLSPGVHADSSCWHEEKLFGTPAQFVIRGAEFVLRKKEQDGSYVGIDTPALVVDWDGDVCHVPHYDKDSGAVLGTVNCSALLCVDSCGMGLQNENASLAGVQEAGGFVQVLQRDLSPIWLKWRVQPGVLSPDRNDESLEWADRELWWNNKEPGVLSDNDEKSPLYKNLGGEPVGEVSSQKPTHAYQMINSVKYQGAVYLELQRFVLYESVDNDLNIGPADGVFYVKHRDEQGNLLSVISAYFCD